MKCTHLAVGVLGVLIATGTQATAVPITITETVYGSGSFGGTSFTTLLITFTAIADTSGNYQRQSCLPPPGVSLLYIYTTSATVDVARDRLGDVPTDTFPDTFVNHTIHQPGSRWRPTCWIFSNAAFATYGLTTSLGPVTGPASTNTSVVNNYLTSGADFELFSIAAEGTYQAVVAGFGRTGAHGPDLASIAVVGVLVSARRRAAHRDRLARRRR